MKKYLSIFIFSVSLLGLFGCSDASVIKDSDSVPIDSNDVTDIVSDSDKESTKTNSGDSGEVNNDSVKPKDDCDYKSRCGIGGSLDNLLELDSEK